MKSKKLSSTQSNLAESPVLESTDQDYNFCFEDPSGKQITSSNPIEIFDSLDKLDAYLARNPELLEMEDAGFAGYINYEGDCEFGLYEKIKEDVIGHRGKGRSLPSPRILSAGHIIYPDPEKYIQAVKRCQDYIKEGDIYQANITHRFIVKGNKACGLDLYQRLKELNPAPYMGYMNFKKYQIISSSPESFLSIKPLFPQQWKIASSPIKGTASLKELDYLLASSKEKAEHIMIVDLIRNDLGRICQTGSIEVPEILATHKFKNLYHLVSTVSGKLKQSGLPKFKDIFAATFPGGSITGTPKIRAMEIIKELESSPRGPYTGSMGYFKFKDGGEFNILIRSIIIDKTTNETSFHVGSGITANSDPQRELEESYLKAQTILEVFNAN
ncbi:MAG: anthranilate synthase component I family protein [Cyanobacteria bacterium]|nr:anthranilate synthase component I family protein [Cyanobacteriota bacterium]